MPRPRLTDERLPSLRVWPSRAAFQSPWKRATRNRLRQRSTQQVQRPHIVRGDKVLADAARDLIAKIATAVPEHLRPFIAEPSIAAPPSRGQTPDGLDMAKTRHWIRSGRKLRIRYRNEAAQDSERVIWPVIVGYAETVRLLVAWCELRQAFRHFRTDRIVAAVFLEERHGCRLGELRHRWKREREGGSDGRLS